MVELQGTSLGSHRQQFEAVFQHFKTDTVFVVEKY